MQSASSYTVIISLQASGYLQHYVWKIVKSVDVNIENTH